MSNYLVHVCLNDAFCKPMLFYFSVLAETEDDAINKAELRFYKKTGKKPKTSWVSR